MLLPGVKTPTAPMARVRGASSTTLDSGRLTAASMRSHTGTPQVGEHLLVERDRQGVRHADARRPVRPGRRHQDRTALPQPPERGRPAPPRTGRRSARRPARGRAPGRSHPPAVYLHVPSKEALVEAVVRSRFGQRLRNAIADLPALPGVPDVPALRRLRPRLVRGAVGWTVCDVVRREDQSGRPTFDELVRGVAGFRRGAPGDPHAVAVLCGSVCKARPPPPGLAVPGDPPRRPLGAGCGAAPQVRAL
jgi:hypothetical protein